MAAKMVKFVLKSAVAGSLVYVTLRATHGPPMPNHIENFYAKRDLLSESDESITKAMFTNGQTSYDFQEFWNRGVKKVFRCVHEAPSSLEELSKKTLIELRRKYDEVSK